jgi:RNA polymerase sigma factor (TIGR02999 family)
MPDQGTEDITRLIEATGAGDSRAADDLLKAVYDELRTVAAARMAREKPGQTMQATALVHEAYLRLLGNDDEAWNGRAHFFGAAAEAMRRILIEQARKKATVRHGSERRRQDIEQATIAVHDDVSDLQALNEALDRLDREDPKKATLVKLRYFTGLTNPQAADALGISHATAERHWAYSRARLYQWMTGSSRPEADRET